MRTHDHPLFTRIYRRIAGWEEQGVVGEARSEAAAGLSGHVLVVGLGPGFDLGHLPDAVTEVTAIEPSASMRESAADHVAAFDRPIRVIDAVAEDLPLPDASVDGVLFAYVLCTVADPDRALAETRRVLRPDGVVGILEHVRAGDTSWTRRWQRLAAPVWPYLAGGCHCDRDTRATFEATGFDTAGLRDTVLVNVPPVSPALVGTARPRPSAG
ncbi:MAG: class I SAM-dependent methyltransferase [Candidatus Nanopelagicales bacterium]